MKRKQYILLCFFICANLWLQSAIFEIKLDGTGDFTTIQEGINESANGDTILVYPGTYYENINFSGKDITVASLLLTTGEESYINNTVIDGNQNGSVVVFENNETDNALLMGFRIQNGSGYNDVYANLGGGIFINFSSPSLKYLLVQNNYARGGGGIHFSSSNAYLEAVNVKSNHAYTVGGGIKIGRLPPNPINSSITFSSNNKCSIYNNSAGYTSEIYISENHTPIINIYVDTLSIFEPDWNFVSQFPNISLNIDHEWLEQVENDLYVSPDGNDNNSGLTEDEPLKTIQWALTKIKADSQNSRNIYLDEGTYSPAFSEQLFPLNMRAHVNIIGAGIDETFLEDPVGRASFIYAWFDENISISSCTFRNRTGDYLFYSSLFLSYSDTNLSEIKIENCESESRSSIYSNYMDIELNNVQIINNRGFSSVGISTYQQENQAILNNCIFVGNDQYEQTCGGGALHIYNMNYARITNCLFAKNHAFDNMWPNANIYLLENDSVDFYNNTIYDNTSNGGAIAVGGGGTINIKNSIIYNNINYQFQIHRGDEPSYVNVSHSLIQGGTNPSILNITGTEPYGVEFIWGEGIIDSFPDLIGGDDEYDPLFYQLSAFSPCIDAGTPDTTGLNLPAYDLAGNPRIYGDAIDIGAYEWQGTNIENDEFLISNIKLKNYPNPFGTKSNKAGTTISFNLTESGQAVVDIYNIKGQKIKTLMDAYTSPGSFELIWNGKDDNNQKIASGTYFYRLTLDGEERAYEKMLLVQ